MNKHSRFRGEKLGGEIVESNDLEAFNIEDFKWIEETHLITKEEYKNTFPSIAKDLHVHESDGLSYLSYPPQCKCKICGEFYRVNKL